MRPLPGPRGEAEVVEEPVDYSCCCALSRNLQLVKLPRAAGNGERGNLLLHDRPMQRPANWRLRTDAQDDSR
jgi:hypothetical protein